MWGIPVNMSCAASERLLEIALGRYMTRMILGLDLPGPCADVNQDEAMNMGDLIKVERVILGLV